MTYKKWVKTQFQSFKSHKHKPPYRDVLIITSFIETVIRQEASRTCGKSESLLKKSLGTLGLVIDKQNQKRSSYKQNCRYKKDYLKKINVLRVQRNELLHDIIGKRLPEKYIANTIKKMARNIEHICIKSHLVRDYFVRNYKFDPAELV